MRPIIAFFIAVCFHLQGNQPSIIFVHLGGLIPPSLMTTLKQARYLNQTAPIYLLTDGEAYHHFTSDEADIFEQEKIELIDMTSIPCTEEHTLFCKGNREKSVVPKGFWFYALERFFYLFDFIKHHNLDTIVHLENDTMLYVDLKESLIPFFEKENIELAAPFQSRIECIPCFVYIKNRNSLKPLINHLLAEMVKARDKKSRIGFTDMQALAHFYHTSSYMTLLPTLMPSYATYYNKNPNSYKQDSQTTLKFLSQNSKLFPGYIFDAATLGIYINGNDPKTYPGRGAGTVHPRTIFDPHYFDFVWTYDEQGRSVPSIFFKGQSYRIVNLHFHSKKPKGYTSYELSPLKLPSHR